jgi:hypothetical protein
MAPILAHHGLLAKAAVPGLAGKLISGDYSRLPRAITAGSCRTITVGKLLLGDYRT